MDNLDKLFRRRIGISDHETITFEHLDVVLEKIAREIPFENLCVIQNRASEITKENLLEKIISRNEGGLCYELNTILYLFLLENGFTTTLVRGITFDAIEQQWSATGRTHVVNILTHDGQQYLVDTGFGGNLPLKPVPLNGDMVKSSNGEFRVEKADSELGDYYLYMNLKHKQSGWQLGYAFDSSDVVRDLSELNEVQRIISEHPESRFNKKPLVTRLHERGNIILTDTSFTKRTDEYEEKKEIDHDLFLKILMDTFGIKSYGL